MSIYVSKDDLSCESFDKEFSSCMINSSQMSASWNTVWNSRNPVQLFFKFFLHDLFVSVRLPAKRHAFACHACVCFFQFSWLWITRKLLLILFLRHQLGMWLAGVWVEESRVLTRQKFQALSGRQPRTSFSTDQRLNHLTKMIILLIFFFILCFWLSWKVITEINSYLGFPWVALLLKT